MGQSATSESNQCGMKLEEGVSAFLENEVRNDINGTGFWRISKYFSQYKKMEGISGGWNHMYKSTRRNGLLECMVKTSSEQTAESRNIETKQTELKLWNSFYS